MMATGWRATAAAPPVWWSARLIGIVMSLGSYASQTAAGPPPLCRAFNFLCPMRRGPGALASPTLIFFR